MGNLGSHREDISKRPLHKLAVSDYYYLHVRAKLRDPNKKDRKGNTLLHVAARSHEKTSKIVQFLIEKDADVDSTNRDGHTPLHFAVFNRNRDTVNALIEAGASVNSKDSLGRTALHLSICNSTSTDPDTEYDISIVERLLCHPEIILDPINKEGDTPLLLAVRKRNSDVVKALLMKGADPNIPNTRRRTPLLEALSTEYPHYDISIVEQLLCHPEIILDPIDEEGDTPLLLAVRERNADVVKALLKKGADPNIPNRRRRTPLLEALSSEYPHYDVVGLLLRYGAGIYSQDIFQQSAVDFLVRTVHADDQETILFAKHVVWLIALRYHIKDCFWRTLEQIPYLHHFLQECCKEVNLMKKKVICDNVTLHDFALSGFQTKCRDRLREIYLPVVEILVFGSFQIYGDLLFCRLSEPDLHSVLEKTVGRPSDLNFAPFGVSRESAFIIRRAYGFNTRLIKRLKRLEHLI